MYDKEHRNRYVILFKDILDSECVGASVWVRVCGCECVGASVGASVWVRVCGCECVGASVR